ncbi:hypothetical protein [uncultured Tateyamaria sp.]|uniref:hypothetical protein n=1 Tax=uncultured Tateyamaria sp. TaxID=455651 RepID=UPI00260C2A37|nr:hypothetical protein [uncultured Tateyamaria sp.]
MSDQYDPAKSMNPGDPAAMRWAMDIVNRMDVTTLEELDFDDSSKLRAFKEARESKMNSGVEAL